MKSKMEVTSEEIKIIFLPENEFEEDFIEKLSNSNKYIAKVDFYTFSNMSGDKKHSIEITASKNKSNNEKHN